MSATSALALWAKTRPPERSGPLPAKKLLKKVLTTGRTCDILSTERGKERRKMTEWYMNPELHDEDYAELMALLREEEEEEE